MKKKAQTLAISSRSSFPQKFNSEKVAMMIMIDRKRKVTRGRLNIVNGGLLVPQAVKSLHTFSMPVPIQMEGREMHGQRYDPTFKRIEQPGRPAGGQHSHIRKFTVIRADCRQLRKWTQATVYLDRMKVNTLGHALALISKAFDVHWGQNWVRNLFFLDGREICSMTKLFTGDTVIVGVGDSTCLTGQHSRHSCSDSRANEQTSACFLPTAGQIADVVRTLLPDTVSAEQLGSVWENRMLRRFPRAFPNHKPSAAVGGTEHNARPRPLPHLPPKRQMIFSPNVNQMAAESPFMRRGPPSPQLPQLTTTKTGRTATGAAAAGVFFSNPLRTHYRGGNTLVIVNKSDEDSRAADEASPETPTDDSSSTLEAEPTYSPLRNRKAPRKRVDFSRESRAEAVVTNQREDVEHDAYATTAKEESVGCNLTRMAGSQRPAVLSELESEDTEERRTAAPKPNLVPLVLPSYHKPTTDEALNRTFVRKESGLVSFPLSEVQNRVITRLNVHRVLKEAADQHRESTYPVKESPCQRAAQLRFTRPPQQQTNFTEASKLTELFASTKPEPIFSRRDGYGQTPGSLLGQRVYVRDEAKSNVPTVENHDSVVFKRHSSVKDQMSDIKAGQTLQKPQPSSPQSVRRLIEHRTSTISKSSEAEKENHAVQSNSDCPVEHEVRPETELQELNDLSAPKTILRFILQILQPHMHEPPLSAFVSDDGFQ
ncbi:Serine/threonine-protein kinase dclk3 [Sparganum proliferum]